METTLKEITQSAAVPVLVGAGASDPASLQSASDMAAAGSCFELTVGQAKGVFSVSKQGAMLWVHGAASLNSGGLTGPGLAVIQEMAARAGCSKIGLQTARPGLVKLCKKSGFKVSGFILQKSL